MRALFVTMPLLVSSAAFADVRFDVQDHGDTVEVIAHGVTARSTNVSQIRSRLEVPLAGNPIANKQLMADPTVLQVELDGIGARVLSVKTRLDRPEVHALAPLAKAEQIGDDLHLTFPRHANMPTVAKIVDVKAPETKADEIKIEPKPAPIETKPEPKIAAKAEPIETKPETKPETKIDTKLAPPAAATTQPAAPMPPPAAKLQPANEQNTNIVMYGAAGILALLGAAYVMRKKKRDTAATSTIDIVAQRALGNKSKVMWLAAGSREILVAVTNQNVRMLGAWPRTPENAAPLPTARLSLASIDSAPALPSSPSVAGIMKLRAQTAPVVGRAQTQSSIGRAQTYARLPSVNEEVATDDVEADLEWAQEILTATGGRR